MIRLTSGAAERIRSALAESGRTDLLDLLPAKPPKRRAAANPWKDAQTKARKAQDKLARAAWRAYVGWVRERVWELSDSRCENCHAHTPWSRGELDHVRAGSHREASTSIDGTRWLCTACHTDRHAEPRAWAGVQDYVLRDRVTRWGKDKLETLRAEEMEQLRRVKEARHARVDPAR